jgi:hypothetical protein
MSVADLFLPRLVARLVARLMARLMARLVARLMARLMARLVEGVRPPPKRRSRAEGGRIVALCQGVTCQEVTCQ